MICINFFLSIQYIPGDPKGELGAESLSRSSSVAPNNPPSGVVSPSVDLLHQHHQRQRLREELRVDEDMKQEPDDQAAQMHYRYVPSSDEVKDLERCQLLQQ